MNDYLDFEVNLAASGDGRYRVEARVSDPKGQTLREPERGLTALDVDAQREKLGDMSAYGRQLFAHVFAPANVLKLYDEVVAVAQHDNRTLRMRLFIDRDAAALHDLRWETLADERPGGGWLLTRDKFLFSRFLSSPTWEPAPPRAEGDLRALVVVANPGDLAAGKFQAAGKPLAPIDTAQEIQRAKDGLGGLYQDQWTLVSDPLQPGTVTLDALRARLREGFDVLYLVCHGTFITRGETRGPQLLLEQPDGSGVVVPGASLAEDIRNLAPQLRPRLVVLASCESAGGGAGPSTADAGGMLAALGPQLAMAGVPAVLAMQGSVAMATLAGFMPAFFKVLQTDDGQIDQAMAVARAAVKQQPDAWMPVLYLRLRDGNLWYTPRFGGDAPDLLWGRLLAGLGDQGRCTPVVGPRLSEYLCGPPRQIAREWAQKEQFPLGESSREELPQVAQFLANRDGPASPRRSLIKHLAQQVTAKFGPQLPAVVPGKPAEEMLELQIAEIARFRFQSPEPDLYRILARLPFHIYINTNPDNLLVQALTEAGRPPVVDYARWNDRVRVEDHPSQYEEARKQNYAPSFERPLVYHLFGVLRERDSLILSEDDYFDYLMWINQLHPSLPPPVGSVLSNNGLLFLGFGIQDWNFRLLFRSLLTEQRRKVQRDYKSVAVQVRPGDDILNADQARRYLEQYFAGIDIAIYWGSVDEFVTELWERAHKEGLA